MAEPAHKLPLSYEEFLAFELASEVRHEFHDGEVFEMVGGTLAHSRLSVRLAALLDASAGDGVHVLNTDFRVLVPSANTAFYPDMSVAIGQPAHPDGDTCAYTNPAAVFEVLSPSTEAYDRGVKFDLYRQLPTLADYVLLSAERVHVEHRARQPDGSWLLRFLGPGDTLRLTAAPIAVEIDALYRPLHALWATPS